LRDRRLAVGGDKSDLAKTRPSEHARTVPLTRGIAEFTDGG
jgi:hypothetical protein